MLRIYSKNIKMAAELIQLVSMTTIIKRNYKLRDTLYFDITFYLS